MSLEKTKRFVYENKTRVGVTALVMALVGAAKAIEPRLPEVASLFLPAVAAAALVIPLKMLLRIASNFEKDSYKEISPIIEKCTEYRFIVPAVLMISVPTGAFLVGAHHEWYNTGSIPFLVSVTSVSVFIWSEGLHQKNYYFDRWYPVERIFIVVFGALSVFVGPTFIPIFLFVHQIIINQFEYPRIGGFNFTHSRLPQTALLIVSSFSVVGLFIKVYPSSVFFLLMCGYASHYFHPGTAKLYNNGPLYYILNNNPIFMFPNAYKIGWMSFVKESSVIKVGVYTDYLKPLINISVVAIEVGTVFILLDPTISIVIVCSVLLLHLLILISTGDNFWKWIAVNASILLGMTLFVESPHMVIGSTPWFLISIGFIVFADIWMDPVGMSWLDPPYVEYFELKASFTNGKSARLDPNIFRPYDVAIAQGITGSLTFLGKNPRITYSYGSIPYNEVKNLYDEIVKYIHKERIEEEKANKLVQNKGVDMYNGRKKRELITLFKCFLENKDNGYLEKMLRCVSCPREFYSLGTPNYCGSNIVENIDEIRMIRVDGVWTANGFNELDRENVLVADL